MKLMSARQLPSALFVKVESIERAQGELLAEERALLHAATRVRRREVIAGRVLAHRLMEQAGYDTGPVTQHTTGAPLWPNRLCGSIAHSADIVAVAIAPLSSLRSVGIDIEDGRDLGEATSEVASDEEVRAIVGCDLAPDTAAASRLLFSAKEALFKCQAPITGNIDLSFEQIRLRISPSGCLTGVVDAAVDSLTAEIARHTQIVMLDFQGVKLVLAWLEYG